VNAVFDLGNVLLRWDPRFLYRKIFADEERMEWFLTHVCTMDWVIEQDHGRSYADGVALLQAKHPDLADEIAAFDLRWHETLPAAIDGTVDILHELHGQGVPLFAITNWNGPKYHETKPRFPFLGKFRDVVVSGDERLLKPDPAIFHLLLKRNGLNAQDCIFIDDNAANVRGAEAIGMRGHHFTSPDGLRKALSKAGILN
jgi:2-haloacid dehalogenase